jgi:hypothetical protein
VIIPAVVVSKNNNSQEESSSALGNDVSAENRPRSTYQEVVQFIVDQGISTESEVTTPETPQYKAAWWLAQDDPANVPVPTTSDRNSYDGYRYMTRYVMAVNYYAFDGPNWRVDINWMNDLDICDWNRQLLINGNPSQVGLFCNNSAGAKAEDGTVTILRTPSVLKLSMYA